MKAILTILSKSKVKSYFSDVINMWLYYWSFLSEMCVSTYLSIYLSVWISLSYGYQKNLVLT